jgi:hypothetical protein
LYLVPIEAISVNVCEDAEVSSVLLSRRLLPLKLSFAISVFRGVRITVTPSPLASVRIDPMPAAVRHVEPAAPQGVYLATCPLFPELLLLSVTK